MESLDKWVTHAAVGTVQGSMRFHHPGQNGARCKMYKLLISGI